MRRGVTAGVVGAAVLLAAAGAGAQTVHMRATLSGSNETPPPGVLTGAHGMAEVTVNLQTQVVTYIIRVFNMPTGVTGAHFHVGGPGLAGPVVVNFDPPLGATDDFQIAGTAGPSALVPRTAQGIRTWTDFIQALVAGEVYVNVHSQANPGGEVRGQVLFVRRDP